MNSVFPVNKQLWRLSRRMSASLRLGRRRSSARSMLPPKEEVRAKGLGEFGEVLGVFGSRA